MDKPCSLKSQTQTSLVNQPSLVPMWLSTHLIGQLGTRLNQTLSRGITTYKICVEVFATGNQGIKVTSKLQQRTKNVQLQSDLWPIKNQVIKSFRRNDQAVKHTFLPIKNLDPSCKCFNRQRTSDYPSPFCFQYVTDTENQWYCGKERVRFARLDYIPGNHKLLILLHAWGAEHSCQSCFQVEWSVGMRLTLCWQYIIQVVADRDHLLLVQ